MNNWTVAWRSLTRRRGFATAVILILALGIAANTAVFVMVDAVLLKPFPYPNAGRLVSVMEASPAKHEKVSLIAPARLADWQRLNHTFDALGASYSDNVTDTSGSEPERLAAQRVSPGFFNVYGVAPLLGRTFTAAEQEFGGPHAAVITYSFWTRRFGRDPQVLGRRLIVGGQGFSIVGVMPKSFTLPSTANALDLWLPAQFNPSLMRIREARFLIGVGRMKPGVTIEQARADLDRIQAELARQYPNTDKGWSAQVIGLKDWRVGDYRRSLWLAFGAVALLLLIAIANIAGLMLSQLERRGRELAIRSSIGATRVQVALAVMREAALISAAGVALGCAAASWLIELLARAFKNLPHAADFQLDWRALAFAACAGALTAVLCGILPALQATRADLAVLLARREVGRAEFRRRWQPALVAGQIALSIVLLTSAGLMLRSYYNLSHVDVGFDAEHAMTFHVSAAWDEDRKRVGEFQEELLKKLRATPGVEAAGFTNFLPTEGATLRYQVALEGAANATDTGRITVGERSITRGYLPAMGAPLIAGQECPPLPAISDHAPKALVSSRFARQFAPGQNIVGRHLRWFDMGGSQPMEIVGVAGEMREDTLNTSPAPYIYVCIAPGGWPDPEYVVRTSGDPRLLRSNIYSLVRGIDGSRAVFGVKPLQDLLDQGLRQPRLNTRMLGFFAFSAIALACVGLYSLMSLLVTARTREIGVRMALGAEPYQILWRILASVGRLVAIGVSAGLALTLFADRVLRSLLFGLSPMDPLTIIAAVIVLAGVAVLASIAPARRAARIDPIDALRME
jgi:predicted permease